MSRFQEYIRSADLDDTVKRAICECAMVCFGSALLEGPHVSLEYDPSTHTDIVWDFYDERPEGHYGKWLLQLVHLFRDGEMEQIYSPTGNPERYVLDESRRQEVADCIASSFEFKLYGPYGYMEADQETKELVDTWLPPILLDILHEKRTPR